MIEDPIDKLGTTMQRPRTMVLLDQQHLHHWGTCLKCRFSGLAPDLLNQQFKGRAQNPGFEHSLLVISWAHYSFRTTKLQEDILDGEK